jgi:heme/copper-type cytochrome/quinol oxidase subunit 2
MIELLEIAGGIVDAIRAWRLSVCLAGGAIAGWFAIDLTSDAMSATVVFVGFLVLGMIAGAVWQYRHSRRPASITAP